MKQQQPTIITSIIDFFNWISKVHTQEIDDNLSFPIEKVYYRGQANIDWDIQPSIFREEYDRSQEHELLLEASRSLWNELNFYRTYLEKLIYLQHYGLATCLLDVTFNPLVALYFACDQCDDKDGVVFSGYNCNNYIQNPLIAELSAEYLFCYETNEFLYDLEKFANEKNVKITDFMKSIFIMPPMNNPRIEIQNGAFIMPPLIQSNNHEQGCKRNYIVNQETFFEKGKKAIIEQSKKKDLRNQLAELGIHRGTILGSVTDKLIHINESARNIPKTELDLHISTKTF